ncbi:AAA family ATPase [Vogesella alkaliphila]|uniref:ATP-binding protein n=1 Tax=Vogesella alkaliphila TaxID=1193621 RepID=A0ABQ2YQI0_9NEIS|nr:AAA family ATPase [Vogesella alkaliphila]GGX90445.1 ATP-binding protein [Vogesella alkaliphila]
MQNVIEYFDIEKLHGHKNVRITFDSPYKILLSENGQGKTTILKIMDAIFSKNFKKLRSINFESATIKLTGRPPISIKKDNIAYDYDSKALNYLSRKLPPDVLTKIIDVATKPIPTTIARREINKIIETTGITISLMAVRELIEDRDVIAINKECSDLIKEIDDGFPLESLYLPTYRRIEDDGLSIGISQELGGKELIQFGLTDVEKKLEGMRNNVLESSKESMARINSEILTRLVNGLKVNADDLAIINENKDKISIALSRVATTLSTTDKKKIITLVESGEIFQSKTDPSLVYFLSKMVMAFLDQRNSDQALEKFSELCSKYFVNKVMIYDQISLKTEIICKETGNEIKFGELSSGEKQVVSLFSKLLLEPEKKFALLFDEPELSLSVEWQQKILHDVISCNSCAFLIAMTHSPFIFTDLSQYTSDLQYYINRSTENQSTNFYTYEFNGFDTMGEEF